MSREYTRRFHRPTGIREEAVMTVLQSSDGTPGTWRGNVHRSRISAIYTDPNGHELDLAKYEILKNGIVLPSVLCTLCGFNKHIVLSGWMA